MHNDILQVGSDLFLTDAFGSNGFRLKRHNAQDRTQLLNIGATKLARRPFVVHFSATRKKAIVAGSIGPTGELFKLLGQLNHASLLSGVREQADALAGGGVDVLWIETTSSNDNVAAVIEVAKTTGLLICAGMIFDTASRSMIGVMPADFAKFAGGLGANFIGAHCGISLAELLRSGRGVLAASGSLPVVV